MSNRSLIATETGIKIARIALTGKKLTQEKLMELVDVQSRSTISNFFTGKPVDRQIFVKICEKLEINWQEVSGQLPSQSEKAAESESVVENIEALVKLARERCAEDIRKRCGTMRVLDMEQPVELTHNQRKGVEELLEKFRTDNFYRWGLAEQKERIEGIEAVHRHSKLMILGKPGSGKTTFLKFLATACSDGNLFTDLVPVFVTLKDFADAENVSSLFGFISRQAEQYGIAETTQVNRGFLDSLFNRDANAIETLLRMGKMLVLLDGLDEVREKDDTRVLREIKEFSQRYSQSQIVVTCRIAAKQYIFEQFTEVEVADFDEQQIATFAGNWFHRKKIKAEDFLEELKKYRGVQELATSPLLLTLLCLAFEESGSFPANRSELYKEGLDALLRKWDAKRGIRRDSVYKDLSVQKKEDMLSQIALTTFEKGDYFVKQRQLEDYIYDYIRNISNAKTNDEELHLDSEAVLKSIESQHGLFVERARGIYSFSHLTFHEYFAARQIVVSTSPSKLEVALQNIVTHITDSRWREVILLSVGMAREADDLLLLMKREIDGLLEGDEKLQSFLVWADEKSRSVNVSYKLVAVRAYYFAIDLGFDRTLNLDQDLDQALNRALALIEDSYRYWDENFDYAARVSTRDYAARALTCDICRDSALDLSLILDLDRVLTFDPDRYSRLDYKLVFSGFLADKVGDDRLYQCLRSLEYRVKFIENSDRMKQWWKHNGKEWITEYRQVLIEHRNIGHDWQFTKRQRYKLKQYYEATKFLVECLKSDCYLRRETRQEIEESLLLPSKR